MVNWLNGLEKCSIQWGSEIQPFEILKHLKSRLVDGRTSNGQALATALTTAMAIVPTIQKPDHSKSGCMLPVSLVLRTT